MRVVQYHPRALTGDGGITRSVRRLSGAMARAGTPTAIAFEDDEPGGPAVPVGPVDWLPVPHRRVRGHTFPLGFQRLLGASDADALILNSGWTTHNVVAGRAARAAGVPYVICDRGAYDPLIRERRAATKRLWWLGVERRLVAGAAALHVFFETQVPYLRTLGWRGEIVVAPNGVTVPAEQRWDGGSGGYLLFVGRFDPEHKGLDLLVRAIGAIPPDRRPDVRLHGPDWRGGKQHLAALVEELGLGRWVRLGPAVYGQAKWDLVTAAAGFVYPSRWEAFGNAPAEAAALGVPVLATPYPLALDLEARGAALLAAPEPDALAEGVESLLRDGRELTGGPAVRQAYSWDEVAALWLRQLTPLDR